MRAAVLGTTISQGKSWGILRKPWESRKKAGISCVSAAFPSCFPGFDRLSAVPTRWRARRSTFLRNLKEIFKKITKEKNLFNEISTNVAFTTKDVATPRKMPQMQEKKTLILSVLERVGFFWYIWRVFPIGFNIWFIYLVGWNNNEKNILFIYLYICEIF